MEAVLQYCNSQGYCGSTRPHPSTVLVWLLLLLLLLLLQAMCVLRHYVQQALQRRLKALEDPRWVESMVTLIKDQDWFRWHDSGDIQSLEHLKNIFLVCKQTPNTKHWMPTREAQFLKDIDPATVPPNLIIRMSSHMIDQGPVKFWPWTSTVSTAPEARTCPAPDQGNECGSCRACWDRSTPNVCYGKH